MDALVVLGLFGGAHRHKRSRPAYPSDSCVTRFLREDDTWEAEWMSEKG